MTTPLFREIEHTADIGIEVEAQSAPDLFRRAGLALFTLMVHLEQVQPAEERSHTVFADNWEDLLHDWLTHLLVDFLQDGFIGKEIYIERLEKTQISSRLVGECLDHDRHEFETEIKAVTYHQLSVQKIAERWRARIIFDV